MEDWSQFLSLKTFEIGLLLFSVLIALFVGKLAKKMQDWRDARQ